MLFYVIWAAVRSKAVVLLLLIFCLLLLQFCESVIVLCFAVRYFSPCIAIILMGKRELVALLNLSSWCLVMVEWLFLAVLLGCLWLVIVVCPAHTHLLFSIGTLWITWKLLLNKSKTKKKDQ